MLMTRCAYSCTHYGLHTQYMFLTHADDLLCLQLHTLWSPYTVHVSNPCWWLALPTAAHRMFWFFFNLKFFYCICSPFLCSITFLFVFSYGISYFYPSSSASNAVNSRCLILSTLMSQTQLGNLGSKVINTKYIFRSQLHSKILSTDL